MILQKIFQTFALTTVFTFASMSASAQDLIARQAPVDRKMKTVDSIAFKSMVERENFENPSSSLYEEWENKRTHAVYPMPDMYKIDLRGFHMPTPSRVITSSFGHRWGRQHKGLDIKVYIGDTIRSAFSGKVRIVRYEGRGYGNYVVIRHNNGLETVYGHLSKQLVHENQVVRAGQPIGLGGNTGRSTGSHLHFETRLCGTAINPSLMFDFRNQDVTGDFYVYRKSTVASESAQATALRGKNNVPYSKENIQGKQATVSQANTDVTRNLDKMHEPAASAKNEINWYTVGNGDTVESVAEKLGMTVENFCRLNRIGRYTQLSKGMLVKYTQS